MHYFCCFYLGFIKSILKDFWCNFFTVETEHICKLKKMRSKQRVFINLVEIRLPKIFSALFLWRLRFDLQRSFLLCFSSRDLTFKEIFFSVYLAISTLEIQSIKFLRKSNLNEIKFFSNTVFISSLSDSVTFLDLPMAV